MPMIGRRLDSDVDLVRADRRRESPCCRASLPEDTDTAPLLQERGIVPRKARCDPPLHLYEACAVEGRERVAGRELILRGGHVLRPDKAEARAGRDALRVTEERRHSGIVCEQDESPREIVRMKERLAYPRKARRIDVPEELCEAASVPEQDSVPMREDVPLLHALCDRARVDRAARRRRETAEPAGIGSFHRRLLSCPNGSKHISMIQLCC